MAYIHKETFDITQGIGNGTIPQDFFEIDELIALPVQVLNRKGYSTISCCSGHPFGWLLNNPNAEEYEILDMTGEINIIFAEGISLPTSPELPPRFVIQEIKTGEQYKISRGFLDVNNAFKTARNILEAMEQLYEWTLKLPEYKNKQA